MSRLLSLRVKPLRSFTFAALVALALTSSALAPIYLRAQTPVGLRNVTKDLPNGTTRQAIAANSAWVGGQLAYRFGGEGASASDLLASGLFTYEVDLGIPLHLPIVTNFGGKIAPASNVESVAEGIEQQMKDLVQSTTGVTAGLFPYYVAKQGDRAMVTFHGIAAWRFNALRPYGEQAAQPASEQAVASDSGENVNLHQIKLGAGIEAVLGNRTNPTLTIGITPVIRFFTDKAAYARAFGKERASLSAVEILTILPVRADGVGLLFESVVGGAQQNSFRVGLILAAKQ